MEDKLEFFNKIKLTVSEFYKNNPCKYCVGNGCDDCRDCSDAKNRYTMETNIYNLKKQYKELYGSDYDEDYWSNTETYTEFDSITVSLEDILKVMDDYITVKMKEE